MTPEREQALKYAERLITSYEYWCFSDVTRAAATEVVSRALIASEAEKDRMRQALESTDCLFTVERDGERINPLCGDNDFTVWNTESEAEDMAEEQDTVVRYVRVSDSPQPCTACAAKDTAIATALQVGD